MSDTITHPDLLQVIDTKLNDETLTVTIGDLKALIGHCTTTKLNHRCHWATTNGGERFLIPGCHEALYSEEPSACTCDTLQNRVDSMRSALRDLRDKFDEVHACIGEELDGSPL